MAELDKNAMKFPVGTLEFVIDVYRVPLTQATKFCWDIEELLADNSIKIFIDTDFKIRFKYIVPSRILVEVRYSIFRLIDDFRADLVYWNFTEEFSID